MDWLKDLRTASKMTQEEVAAIAGVNRATYTKIEIGRQKPSVSLAKRLGAALSFDWTRFYTEEIKAEHRGEGEQSPETAKA